MPTVVFTSSCCLQVRCAATCLPALRSCVRWRLPAAMASLLERMPLKLVQPRLPLPCPSEPFLCTPCLGVTPA